MDYLYITSRRFLQLLADAVDQVRAEACKCNLQDRSDTRRDNHGIEGRPRQAGFTRGKPE